jgi:hypothetical protein
MFQSIEDTKLPTDRELEKRIWAFLEDHHVPSLRHVRIDAAGGVVTLRGRVSSYYARQLVQHSARRLAGDGRVIDELSVATPAAFRDPLRLSRPAVVSAALLIAAMLSGCSKSDPARVPVRPVSGQVTIEGRPAKGAWVVLHPKDASQSFPSPNAYADQQGYFSIGTYSLGDGAPQGEYTVTVRWQPAIVKDGEYQTGPDLVPAKYRTATTSTLTARVNEGSNSIPLKITR